MSDQTASEMLDCDEQLLEMFVSNAADLLDQIEEDLLKLEHMGDGWDDELVNKVFRSAHTIKGESGFVGLDTIGKLAHSIENVLDKVRERIFVADSETINLLLECFDELRQLTEEIEESNNADVSDFVNRLDELAARKIAGDAAPVSTAPEPVTETVQETETEQPDQKTSETTPSVPEKIEEPKPGDVLLVDDDPMILNLLSHHLGKAEITSQTAASCSECLRLLRNNSYRVIVLDFDLPDGEGADIIHEIKNIHPLAQVLMLTGEVNMHNVVNCLEKGAIDFLPKSDDYNLIVEPIQFALERSNRWMSLLNGKRQPANA